MKQSVWLAIVAMLLLFATILTAVLIAQSDARRAFDDLSENSTPPAEDASDADPENDGESNPEQTPNQPEKTENRVSFLAAGDIVLHESVFLDANLRAGESGASGSVTAASLYDFAPMYRYVKDAISGADLAMVNQETLIAASANGIPQGYPGFTGPKAAGDVLSQVGFDVVNVGNNHMLDQGSAGLRRSMEYWFTQSEIQMIGAYATKSDCDELTVVEKNGVRIAILPYLGQTPATNGYLPDDQLYIPYLNEELVRTQMAKAREIADCVIVTVHWGTEGTYTPNSEQQNYANMFASLGADALIGTHPHVLQPMQWVERTGYEGGGRMLLCYSLGDFLSHTQLAGGKNRLGNLLGGYVTFDIVKDEAGVTLESARFVPTVSHYDENTPLDTNFIIYPLSEYSDALLKKFGDPNAGFTSIDQLSDIVKRNIPSEFLSD